MNNRIISYIAKAFIVSAVLTATQIQVAAQAYIPTPVTISKEKVKVDGVVCYSHIVLERQTLYSISKAYGVSIEDLYRFNPRLKEEGLKKNGILIIPSQPQEEVKEVKEIKEVKAKADTVIVRNEKEEKPVKKEQVKEEQRIHIVKWYEDIEVIADQYGVGAEAIMKANGLKNRKLKNRQKLVIPYADEVAQIEEAVPAQEPEDTTDTIRQEALFPSEKESIARVVPQNTQQKNDIKAALVLPFNATGETSSRSAMDFYSGVLVAAKELGNMGISIDLSVIDISEGLSITPDFLNAQDVVIGPIAPADIRELLQSAPESLMIVSPLDPRAESLARESGNIIQIPTPHSSQYADLVSWITEDRRDGDKVVYISEKGSRNSEPVSFMKEAMDSSGVEYADFSYSILEGREVLEPLSALLTDTGVNRIVIASESEAFVNDVVRNLNLLIYNKYNIVIYGPSKIRSFETIDVESLHNAALHVSLAYNIDYDNPDVRKFLKEYRALFNTEPSQFAFQGYDITSYITGLINRYGDNWKDELENSDAEKLQSRFHFRKSSDGGWINDGIRRIVYDDNWIVRNVD